ncbi:MAG TPA: arsenite methyltransferase [Candidatus Nanoarchaeia archaeon]|nr:arsenite methyltransferase [Candidatus Nanoarchaeia archaeon]
MNTKKVVKEHYSKIAVSGSCCCSCGNKDKIAGEIGYSKEELSKVGDANLGLGCGNPTVLANIKPDDTVLDLGSGAGIDCFLASKKAKKVIGVDFSDEMLKKARANAKKMGYSNVTFKKGDIERLPINTNSVDIIISNCVINLAPNKDKVFKEAYRVLKTSGKMYLSDIVLLKELTPEQKGNKELVAGCVGGALLKNDYIKKLEQAGFSVNILNENKSISKTQYQGVPLESLKVECTKV